ncbi:MAG: hypothetical protein AUJ92_21235 [Armatimonadetes bacterium CG2_30_59_28]|nr:prephenate dehydrogenase/arogenate dehydrogenase family protein [Armatimonadota bacterium]OIO89552.1 MAG: hypothetical protein AUJ92_21235 [Armatimonadetes bacterium CG2_30_59_28]PIU60291.1 MAG: prephenate dehydrogenase/arogenate dehydrogenase family protein [Armatimonadetes bacterium CG07_land_8_20_14_0_80_59_28]PIX45741.1 MAG: prephenate dehydrogenase/arogenate dehydrogenase family protein [Armatimonadetes bacterium CG_4_8_14_3_um_filter_58_9]PIY49376.1 MAG: prephenate dehydrogenase/arogen
MTRGTQTPHTVAILGAGLIGGSIGLRLKSHQLCKRVIGCARQETTLQTALGVGAIDEGFQRPEDAVQDADIVFIATPVADVLPTFERILPHLPDRAIVTDVGSTKVEIVACATRIVGNDPARVEFIGGHPLAGSEKSGPGAARADLFEGATWVLTFTDRNTALALQTLGDLVESLGARTLRMTPEEHDEIVAFTSHLPHIAACALANAAGRTPGKRERIGKLIATGFRDATRLADGSPELWRQICMTNREPILQALQEMRGQLNDAIAFLKSEDAEALTQWLQSAAATRARLVEQ